MTPIFTNKSVLKLEFEISCINNSSMSLSFDNDGKIETFNRLDEGQFRYQTAIEFPAKFKIILKGKSPRDTQIDEHGNITKDKYVKLTDIRVDNISCFPEYLYQHINLHTLNGEKIQSNYWGFNGCVELKLDQKNSFFWVAESAYHPQQ